MASDGKPSATGRATEALARLETPATLRKGLGSPALFGIVQGFVAASIYFGLGLVSERALGYTWIVAIAASLFFVLLVLSYVEGASLHQERGGATVIARYGFNELWSFVAGWAIMLDYLLLIAITAFTIPSYMAVVWGEFDRGLVELCTAAAVIAYVAWVNIRGPGNRRFERSAILVLADLLLQLTIVGLGVALLLNPDVLSDPAGVAGTPEVGDVLFAFTIAIVAFVGIDASSGLAGQVAVGRRGLRRLIAVRMPAAIVPFVGLCLVAVSTLPLAGGLEGGSPSIVEAPMIAVVSAFEQPWLREPLRYLVAASAVAILVIACNAGMLGLSRLGYALAVNRQIPSRIGRLHPRRATPVVIIGIGAVLAVALVASADLEFLAGVYAFGATLAFTLVHLSIISLRYREPDRDRPFRMPLNVRVRGGSFPLPAALGALVSAAAFASVIVVAPGSRYVGLGWMAFGLALYIGYRKSEGKPLTRRIQIPERALTRTPQSAEYGSILVPVLGSSLDDDIMQTAGRLAADENLDEGAPESTIEALWVFEMPMALPIDARVPDADLKRARAALARAKAVGEEYDGVRVATATVRARRVGEAIVHEARRRRVEAIVLAAEEPTRIRGGTLLGGREGLKDAFVGETTRYVVNKAPCRVILTAPPSTRAPTVEHPRPQDAPIAPKRDITSPPRPAPGGR